MEQNEYLDAVERESTAFIAAVDGALDYAIPTCGHWTMRDLAGHLGKVWAIATANVAAATDAPTPPGEAGHLPEDDAEVVDWLNERRSAMLNTFRATGPDEDAWSFAPDNHTAGFWQRRMAHETAIHRWDAENGLGEAGALDPELSRDGINEYFAVGLRYSSAKPNRVYPSETLHLHRTDGDGEWMLRGEEDQVEVTEEHAKGDAAVRGSAEALLLWIWGRSDDGVEVLGATHAADAWQAVAP